jgi:hypothetical protein
MVIRIKAVLIALGLGFMVANCAPAPSLSTNTEAASLEIRQSPAEQRTEDVLDPTRSFEETREETRTTDPLPTGDDIAEATRSEEENVVDPTRLPPETDEVEQSTATPLDVVDKIDANLERLAALEIFEVGQLIVDIPEEAYNCYGPCPGFENAEADAIAESAQHLADLADLAECAAAWATSEDACDATTIDANLKALDALGIVEVGQLLVAEPVVTGNCYAIPCQPEIAAAEALTCERAGMLANIVDFALESFEVEVETPETLPELSDVEAQALENIDANLERLDALEVFEVGELIIDVPAGAYNCYGPCPGFETAEADAEVESALRLAAMADAAEASVIDWTIPNMCESEVIEANLEALEALDIVDVGDLLVAEPVASAHCYDGNPPAEGGVCPKDISDAEAETCHRARRLASIVADTEEI